MKNVLIAIEKRLGAPKLSTMKNASPVSYQTPNYRRRAIPKCIVWICLNCKNLPVGDYGRKGQFFEKYVDDIICTAKTTALNRFKSQRFASKFRIYSEILNDEHEIAFLDMALHDDEQRMITCKWYQQTTDTGTILNYRICAPLQHKYNIIEGTFHRLLHCTSNCKNFGEALEMKEKIGLQK